MNKKIVPHDMVGVAQFMTEKIGQKVLPEEVQNDGTLSGVTFYSAISDGPEKFAVICVKKDTNGEMTLVTIEDTDAD